MKHSCNEVGKRTISQSFTFPITMGNGLSLELLYNKLLKSNWLKGNFNPETNLRGASYISISFMFLGNKQAFNVFRNGKVRAWFSCSPKAFRYFLDFFYYGIAIDCLEEVVNK